MSYDPIIYFYDDPGHPYWPSKNGGSGGGGAELGPKANITAFVSENTYPNMFMSLEQFDISGETTEIILDAANEHAIASVMLATQFGQTRNSVASGAHVLLLGATPTEPPARNIVVQVDGQTVTTGYETKVLFENDMYFVLVTLQVPQAQTVDVALTAVID